MTKQEALKQGRAARRLLKYPQLWTVTAHKRALGGWRWELTAENLRIVGDLKPTPWFVCYVDGMTLNTTDHKTPDAAIAEAAENVQYKVWQVQRILTDIQSVQVGRAWREE